MATTSLSYRQEMLGNARTCQSQCQSQQSCNFVQWNNSTGICQFFNSDIEEIYKDQESLLVSHDCNNIADLWKKKPIIATSTAAAAAITTTTTTTMETKTISDASKMQENMETWPAQNSTNTR
jgi:hypothetical protein